MGAVPAATPVVRMLLELNETSGGLRCRLTNLDAEPKLDPHLIIHDMKRWSDSAREFVATGECRKDRVFQSVELDSGRKELYCDVPVDFTFIQANAGLGSISLEGYVPGTVGPQRDRRKCRFNQPGRWRVDCRVLWADGEFTDSLYFDWDGQNMPRKSAATDDASRVTRVQRVLREAATLVRFSRPHASMSIEEITGHVWPMRMIVPELLKMALRIPKADEYLAFLRTERDKYGADREPCDSAAEYLDRLADRLTEADVDPGFVIPERFEQFNPATWPKNRRT
jgi:hypothetical protein